MKLDPFYPLVDSSAWVERLVPLGVRLVQLRIKDRLPEDLCGEISRSQEICRRHDCRLIVNDHWQEAIAEGCGFVHLGQEDLADADLAAIRKAGMQLGVSTHDGDELEKALSVDPDYVALGPVFPTGSKDLKWTPQGLEKIAGWKRQVGDLPLVAIGGITLERSAGVYENGADSIAVIGDVLRHNDPEARVQAWLVATQARR
ncbi:thiamine phosphate synthase [Roseibium aggregatum]|uniref:Thiamine-phosphate synthase n=1 Tax=Roseibium aggregatum TaxID=187304 RepID=A0A939ECM3_9HYPH|nr:thiamine phosphate synthase [Roseibium aggregatum]MBN9670144.1 thiamine phosphate synthase [Roseibium aggregatum]